MVDALQRRPALDVSTSDVLRFCHATLASADFLRPLRSYCASSSVHASTQPETSTIRGAAPDVATGNPDGGSLKSASATGGARTALAQEHAKLKTQNPKLKT